MKNILLSISIMFATLISVKDTSAQSNIQTNSSKTNNTTVKTNAKSLKKASKLSPTDNQITKSESEIIQKNNKAKATPLQPIEEKKKPIKSTDIKKDKVEK